MPDDFSGGDTGLPPEMVRDLRTVSEAETHKIEALSQALRQESGVLTEGRVENLVRQFLDDEVAEPVTRTIQYIRPELKQNFLKAVARYRTVSEERSESLTDVEFDALRRNLDILIQDYPSLELMRKAQRLLRDTGNEIDDTIIICDLRPVFDEPQERVEGFVALANLRFRYISQSGNREAFEIALTEDELSKLVEQGQKALKKLKVLKETVHDLVQ